MNTTVTAADGDVTVTDGTVPRTGDECFPRRDGARGSLQQ